MPNISVIFCFWGNHYAILLPVFFAKNVLLYGHIESPGAEKRTFGIIIGTYNVGAGSKPAQNIKPVLTC